MGQPQHTNNVRRIDFTKAATRPPRTRPGETEARARNFGSADRDQLKVVSLPEPRRRPHPRRSLHNVQSLAIIIMAALLGALIAAILLDPAL
jgi:hypothetical protein